MTNKLCYKCEVVKPVSEFFKRKRNSDGYATQCKICAEASHKFKYKTDEQYRKRRVQNTVDSKRKKEYGVNREEFKNLFQHQDGLCAICNVSLDGSRKGLLGHLDHCHTTKKVRGILCGECNLALGLFRDNEEFLLSAVQYLKDNK